MASFEEYGVMPEIIKALQEPPLNWVLPRDIQAECIPLILGGGDIMAAAETGSGKTGAFALPILQVVYETIREQTIPKKTRNTKVEVLVVMNNEDRDHSISVSPDGYTIQSRLKEQWAGIRANVGVLKGCHYFEVLVEDEGACRVGWSTRAARLELGSDSYGFGYGFTGKKSNTRQFNDYGVPFGKGDYIGCYLDCGTGNRNNSREISFSKNGQFLGTAFYVSPNLERYALYPAASVKNAQLHFNFGAKPFQYPPSTQSPFTGIQGSPPEDILTQQESIKTLDLTRRSPLAIILEPTYELAQQTEEAFKSFRKYMPSPQIRILLLIGQVDPNSQLKELSNGVDIVVASPGRLMDFAESGKLDLSSVRFFVLDEADQLVDQHGPIVYSLFNKLHKSNPLQALLFSATLHSSSVRELGEKICKFPVWIDLKGSVPLTVDHAFVWVDPKTNTEWTRFLQPRIQTDAVHRNDNTYPGVDTPEMFSEAIKILKSLIIVKIINAFKMDQALIFCRTKQDCDNLESYFLSLSGRKGPMIDTEYSCAVVHSGRTQQERSANVRNFKEGKVRFLICTDVAARGIDIKELPYLINYSLPERVEDYIHRVGRVGRADRMGLAISIVATLKEKVWYHVCPSKGKNCNNTKLKEQGGCTIWYEESQYWQNIQKELNISATQLDECFRLPNTVDNKTVYGQKREGDETALFSDHIEYLRPLVQQLSHLEENAQKNWFALRARWSPTQ